MRGGNTHTSDIKSRSRSRWGPAWAFGITFECVLIAAFFAEFKQGWFFVELYNLAVLSHYPFFDLVGDSVIFGTLWLVVYEFTMVLLWTLAFHWIREFLQRRIFPHGVSKSKKMLIILAVAVIAISALGWQIGTSYFDRPTPFAASSGAKSLVEGNNAFAIDLYQQLKSQPDNLFFSPYSISTGMGMVFAGARGLSEREIAGTMHFNLPQTNLHAAFGELAARMNNVQHWNHLALRDANSLWFQRDYSFTPAFMELVRTNYHAEARPVDFISGAQSAGREMLAWIGQRTGGRLKAAFDPAALTPDTRLALCNAIYFNGEWASQFKRSRTEPGPFHVSTNETVTVPMMRQKADFKTVRDYEAQVSLLEMPYYGRDLSMIILMPIEIDGLAGLEQQLTPVNLQSWMAMLDKQSSCETWVLLPRFTITRNIDLVRQLEKMGLTSIFLDSADLSGMEATTNLFISDFLHQAFVEVNEHGTEATALTIAIAKSKGGPGRFTVDHPFIFLIRENATGTILFLGRLADPTKP